MRALVVFVLVSGIFAATTMTLTLIITAGRAQVVLECADERTREHIRMLVMQGLDQALMAQTSKLFDVWMRDTHETPQRAQNGLNLATNAYVRARRNALAWNPRLCP